jgi:hypothetical protein
MTVDQPSPVRIPNGAFYCRLLVGEPNNKFVEMLGRFGVQAFAGDDLK